LFADQVPKCFFHLAIELIRGEQWLRYIQIAMLQRESFPTAFFSYYSPSSDVTLLPIVEK
jgi:hypothetical protein